MKNVVDANLEDIIAKYQQTDFFYRYIPEKIMKHINEKFDLPSDERVMAFLSCFLKKNGVCFTEKGIYWRLIGQGKGCFSWEQLKNTKSMKLKDGVLYLDDKKTFDITGTSYPHELLIEMLEEIKALPIEKDGNDIKASSGCAVNIDKIKTVCKAFSNYEDCSLCKTMSFSIMLEEHIPEMLKISLMKKNKIDKHDTLLAYLNTYLGVGTDGIVISANGVFFSESFLSLFYPWHVFKRLPVDYNKESQELSIGKGNIFHLNCSITKSEEVLWFLNQLQRQ